MPSGYSVRMLIGMRPGKRRGFCLAWVHLNRATPISPPAMPFNGDGARRDNPAGRLCGRAGNTDLEQDAGCGCDVMAALAGEKLLELMRDRADVGHPSARTNLTDCHFLDHQTTSRLLMVCRPPAARW